MTYMRITDGKGLGLLLDNGINVSIQIGGGNYCDNYDFPIGRITYENPLPRSSNAEIAVWDAAGTWLDLGGDEVKGYVPLTDVLRFVEFLRSLPDGLVTAEIELACKAFDWREPVAA